MADARILKLGPRQSQHRRWHRSRPQDNRPKNGTYVDGVAASPDNRLDRVRFARWVDRVLSSARDRGMTDDDIAAATGVGASTFHRWRRADFARAPELSRIRAFCRGLGADPSEAMTALGLKPGPDSTEPEPPLPPEIRSILRYLADPLVPDEDKLIVREMLAMLANQARRPRRRKAS